ncbi:PREDICTED: putative histone-lysine N-methyltransferase 1 [Polistes canadensis]|uniref:putative histone-lysine N-methyltransferase 1 n=1 Tax=Polistes canadensis TaxID=91411 RepID=UPI000718C405|nr:PREDICTED: putative histone-lysine N-methyltransferase 1 [Polistes canadensis]
MSGSGFREQGIEPRSIHPNGPIGAYRGTCSSHPRFNHPRLLHNRLPTPENWSGRSKHDLRFPSWSNAKFQRPIFRGVSHFRHHGRGWGTIHRENLRFPDSNRSSIVPYSSNHNKHGGSIKTMSMQKLHDEDQSKNIKRNQCLQSIPLLGSEEERQKKITETAVRLKEKLSIITNEDITNLWRDDLSIVSSSNIKDKIILKLGDEQPELNRSFNNFKDLDKIDSDNVKSDKNDDINEARNGFNFIHDNVNEVRNSIKGVDTTDIEGNILSDESMTIINDKIVTESKSQKDNDKKSQEDANSPHRTSITLSNISEVCNTELTNSLQGNTGKINMLQTRNVQQSDNTQIHDHELNAKYVNTSLHCQSEYPNSDDMQKSHWKASKYQTNSFRRKPFESRWSHRNHRYVYNRSQNESTRFNPHASSLHLHRNITPLKQDSQYNVLSSFDINRSQSQFPTTSNLMHNKDNLQTTSCVDHSTLPFIPVNISSSQEDILQTVSVFNSWESSTALSYNPHKEQIMNIPNFNPQQPPPNFNNQKGTLPLSSVFDQHLLPQNQSNSTIHALNPLQTSAISVSSTDLYCPVNCTTSSSTALVQATTFSTISQISIPSSSSLLSTAPINFSPKLIHTAPIQMTSYEVTSPATISKAEHQALLYNKALDSAPISNSDNKIKDEFQEIQEAAMQFAKQATNIKDDININTESEQPLSIGIPSLNTSVKQQNVSDVLPSFTQIHENINKEKEQLDQHCNKFTKITLKERVITEFHGSSNFEHEKQLNQNDNVEESGLVDKQIRPKVMFHLNPKLNKINKQGKQLQRIEDDEREQYSSPANDFHQIYSKEYSNQKIEECANQMIRSNQDRTSKHIIEVKDIDTINSLIDESQRSYLESRISVTSDNSTIQRPQDVIKKRKKVESPPSESSWKNRIISRFLKMSKNDIRNMINNSSLRKFNIAMKHLVKEKKSLLSLEMRNTEDEKIKSYDRQEFMDQLNAMLDPAAIVDITNLPTDFIHHLSEVLQLDVKPLESNENIFNYTNDCQNNNSHVFSNEEEILNNNIVSENIHLEEINDRTQAEYNNQSKDGDNIVSSSIIAESNINDSNIAPIVNSSKTNDNRILNSNEIFSKTLLENNDPQIDHFTNNVYVAEKDITRKDIEKRKQHSLFDATDLDDILSTVSTKASGESKSINSEEKSKSTIKTNKTCDEITKTSIPTDQLISVNTTSFISKPKILDSTKQHECNSGNEYISKFERYNRWWTRKERDEPDAFRNLTKEEWEAKHGKKMKSLTSNSSKLQTSRYSDNTNLTNKTYNKTSNSKNYSSPRSFKTNKSSFSRKTVFCKKESKKDNVENDRNTSSSSPSETDDTDSTSSDDRTPSDVAKLLKVIKEKEKIAKNKSLNETIRDEVTAEIHRKWNAEDRKRKYHKKDKRRKEKKLKYREERKKRKKKISESSSNSDNNQLGTHNLLTEMEIKKETNVKEEFDVAIEEGSESTLQIVNNTCSDKLETVKTLTDKKIMLENVDKCTIKESNRITLIPTIIQLKPQLQLIPETLKSVEETEFMKNTAKIVLNAKYHEQNKAPALNNENISEINEDSECPNNILTNVIETEHTVLNNNDNTTKNITNTSIVKEQSGKEQILHVKKEALSIIPIVHESNREKLIDNKATSKKIDIKAYKARKLQRKMKNEEKINEEKAVISNKHAINNDTFNDSFSKSIIEEKQKPDTYVSLKIMPYTNLKDTNSITQTNKISRDSTKFKNIKSEGSRELKLRKEKLEKNKKKIEIKKKIKETKEISSANQEKINNTSDVLKSLNNEVEKNQVDVPSGKHENVQFITDHLLLTKNTESSVEKVSIQNEEISVNYIIPSTSELKETLSEKNKNINNDFNNTKPVDKEKYIETSEINIPTKGTLNNIQTKNTNKNNNLSTAKYDSNNLKFGKRAISTSNEISVEPEICNFINTEEINSPKNENKKQAQGPWNLTEFNENVTNLEKEVLPKNKSVESKIVESVSNCVESSVDFQLNKCFELDESQKNMKISNNSTSITNINVIPQSKQGRILEEDTAIVNQINQNLLENQNNLNIGKNIINSTSNIYDEMIHSIKSKLKSPESTSSPFKGFVADSVEPNSYQHILHLETQSTVIPVKDNAIEDESKQLQSSSNDKFNRHNLSYQDTLYNNISSESSLKDSLNTVQQLNKDEGESSHGKDFRMNDSTTTILSNNFNLLNNKDQMKEMINKRYSHKYAENSKTNEKNTNRFKQSEYSVENNESMQSVNVDKNTHDVSNKRDKIFAGLYECEDNAVMEKPDIDIVKDSLVKQKRSHKKEISDFISTSDMNNTIDSSFSNISNETLNNIINTDTDSSLASPINSNTIGNNNANMLNQDIADFVTNIDSCNKESINDNNSHLNNDTYTNLNYNSTLYASERLRKSFIHHIPKKLKVPTKASLKECTNITTIMDCVKEPLKFTNSNLTEHECENQNIDHFITDQVSQKKNIDNAILNSEQNKSSQDVHVAYVSDNKDLHQCSDVNVLSQTVLNKTKTIHDETLIPSSHTIFIKELIDSNKVYNPTVQSERMKETNRPITDTIRNYADTNKIDEGLNKTSCIDTQKQGQTNNTLHVTNKNIKEEIMARMIDIDVEIHKLMTEKMTLYQMLENDSLLLNKFPLTNNLGLETNRDKTLIRLHTSPTLTSHTMQNMELSSVSEMIQDEIEPRIINIDENKEKSLITEENINCTGKISSHNPKDRLLSECSGSSQSLPICKDERKIQENNKVLSENQLQSTENLDTYNSIRKTSSNVTKSTSLESIPYIEKEKHLCMSPISITKSYKENQQIKVTSHKEKQKLEFFEAPKNNSTQASLIYSDDSTWGSFAQLSENMEEKKHNTGLALLEETYKREIAENRKLKANARKKKKKELNKFLKSVNYLTPEEEEIPLNTLYIKKLQQKRDLLDSLDDKKENSTIDNYENSFQFEKILEHAIEVINAVAEDRVKDLYEEKNEENGNENLSTSSNKIRQNEDKKYFTKPLQNSNSNEEEPICSSLSYDQKQNSIKHSLNITDENVIQQKQTEEEKNAIKDIEVQSTAVSCNNQDGNFAIMNMSIDGDISQKKTSLIDETFTTTHFNIPVLIEANQLNVSNEKLNKDQSNHTLQKIVISENRNNSTEAIDKSLKGSDKKEDCLVNQNTTVNNSIFEKLKYNSKTEENIKQVTEDKGMKIPKIVYETDEITSNIPQISNIQDNKTFKCKISNKNASVHKNSKSIEDNIKHLKHDDTNSNEGRTDLSMALCNTKNISPMHQELENTLSNVKRNRKFHKLESNKDTKFTKPVEDESSIKYQSFILKENIIERFSPNVDSQVLTPKIKNIAVKRKVHNQSEMINCKVRLVDVFKSNLYQHTRDKFKSYIPIYKSAAIEDTINSAHFATSSKTNSLIIETNKSKDIRKVKNISGNVQEKTSTLCQNQVIKTHNILDNKKELKFYPKVNPLLDDEHLSLESNNEGISVTSIKAVPSIMKMLPQQNEELDIAILEERKKDGHCRSIVNLHHDEETPLLDEIRENEQPLKTQYIAHKGPILDIKVFGDTFLAASEDGSIYRYSQKSNEILNIYKGHRSAVTCMYIHEISSLDYTNNWVYSGSLDGTLRCYNVKTGTQLNNIANVGSPVQCMDQAWGIIFIGTKSGHVSRFHIKFNAIKGDSIQFSDKSVLALKATNEGPRRVLIVASRNQPITIRDAQNGLFLRTICGQKNHTVYSLMQNNNLIYCGTSSTSILVFDFTNGEQRARYDAGVGIVCMRLYHKLLFAGCYDGNIYVFDIQDHKLACSIPGPGNMLLSMEVVDNKIIAGSKDKRLQTWQIPKQLQVVSREMT